MSEPRPSGKPQIITHERDERLRPTRPRVWQENTSGAFRAITKLARAMRGKSGKPYTPRSYDQRCIVKVRYDSGISSGLWAARGRYISRTSATLEAVAERGFNQKRNDLDIKALLGGWQADGDARMFKIMLSPESPGIDLHKLTRDTMKQIQKDLGRDVEWVAARHLNTQWPHVHIAMRGRDQHGIQYRLHRNFVKGGIRQIAVTNCNRQIGYRLAPQRAIEPAMGPQIQRVIGILGKLGR